MALKIFEMTIPLNHNPVIGNTRNVPWNAVQTPVTIGVTATASDAFADDTNAVVLQSAEDCHIEFGEAPEATTDSLKLLADDDRDFTVQPGHKVSVIAAA